MGFKLLLLQDFKSISECFSILTYYVDVLLYDTSNNNPKLRLWATGFFLKFCKWPTITGSAD
jgi:hypothetical protein